jgi:hypothetical protein
MLGWRVTASGTVYLTNTYPTPIEFSDLQFEFPDSLTRYSLADVVSNPPCCAPAEVSSGVVPAGTPTVPGELQVDYLASLEPGDFLTGRFETEFQDPNFSPLTASLAFGHEHQEDLSPVGACCYGDYNLECVGDVTEDECTEVWIGTFMGEGSVCGGATRCCLPDGSCVLADALCCELARGKTVAMCLGDNNENGIDDACEVPTVSEWGLIIMTLLLLTAGTIVSNRRRQSVVV